MAGCRVGIPKGPDRGLTSGCRARTVRAPSHGEGRDLDQVFGGRAAERRGTLADSALLWARCRDGNAAARCALIESFAPLAARIAHGMNVPVGAVAHGFVPGRSTVTNATPHVKRAIVVNLDLKDFFPTITFPRVKVSPIP